MTTADLIKFLQTQPQDAVIAYALYSECTTMSIESISVEELCLPRPDGWIQNKRPDQPSQLYIVFPGN